MATKEMTIKENWSTRMPKFRPGLKFKYFLECYIKFKVNEIFYFYFSMLESGIFG